MPESAEMIQAKAIVQCLSLMCVFLPLLWLWLRVSVEVSCIRENDPGVLPAFPRLFHFFFVVLVGCLSSGFLAMMNYMRSTYTAFCASPWTQFFLFVCVLVVCASMLVLTSQFYLALRDDV